MSRTPRVRALLTIALLAAGTVAGAAAAPAAASPTTTTRHYAVDRPLCAAPADPTHFRCFAMAREAVAADTPGAYAVTRFGHGKVGGYSPDDLAKAYGYNSSTAVNQTVAIIDWFDDPRAAADLAAFDKAYGLPAETSTSFRKVNENGRTSPLPRASTGSSTEIALDIQAVRAVCHKCRILLVEANDATSHDLATAVNTAARMGANEISNSYGGSESIATTEMQNAFRHPGVVITASTGDDGWNGWDYANYASDGFADGEPSFPASYPFVVAVGGTSLAVNPADGSRQSETVWNNNGVDDTAGLRNHRAEGASGGGCSRRFTAGTWQWHVPGYSTTRCGSDGRHRVAADIAAVADPKTGLDIIDSYGQGGWLTVGGTSLASPVVAAMYALVGGADGSAYPAASLYVNGARTAGSRYDVVQGGNSLCGGEQNLQLCMDAVSTATGGRTNNPNGYNAPLYGNGSAGDALDCSFSRSGAFVSTPPASSAQCNATTGYDGPSGLGAPTGLGLFRPTAGFGAVVTPAMPRVKHTQTYSASVRERLAGAAFTSYVWTFGDSTPSVTTTGPNANHYFGRAGRFVVQVIVYDSLNQAMVRWRQITIGLAPAVRYAGPRSLPRWRYGAFSSAGSHAVNTGTKIASVVWHWGDGQSSTAARASHRWSHSGRYRVGLTVRDTSGVSHTVYQTVTVS